MSIKLSCTLNFSVSRRDFEDYVQDISVIAHSYNATGDQSFMVGRIAATKIRCYDAYADGVSIRTICDADSEGLLQLYRAIMKRGGKFRDDLDLDYPICDVVLIHEMCVPPQLARYQRAILEAAISLFPDLTIICIWMDNVPLSEIEFADLGFAKVAGKRLAFRDPKYVTPYNTRYPQGETIRISGRLRHEKWIKENWRSGEPEFGPGW